MNILPKLKEGWLTLALLLVMIMLSAIAITQTELIAGLEIIPKITFVALMMGVLIAKSEFKDGFSHFLAVVFGVFFISYFLGTLLPDDLTWRTRILSLIDRQFTWVQKAFSGGTSRDGIIFVIQTSTIYWLLGYTAAWYTFRKPKVWRVVVPAGVVLLSVVYYYNGPKPLPWYLAGYALLALLYIARTFLVSKEKSWRSAAVRYEKGIRFDFLRAGFVVAAVILLAAWSMPTLTANAAVGDALGSTQGPWRNFQDTWTRLFSSLRSYGTATTDAYQDTLVLGGPRTVGTTLIMDVQVKEKLPYVYWQAIAYDTYEDGRWGAEEPGEPTLHFPDDGPIEVPFTRLRQPIDQVITNYIPNSSFLFGAPEVVESNRQMFVSSKTSTKDEELVSSLRSRFVLRQGDQYRVRSKVSNADVSSLRKAALAYPSWVTDRYLQLPETITDETIALADSLVGNIATPLDKAVTIRNYLRANVVYNDQIAAPPDGVDPVHHVLFVSQEGYCNYYASSMAVMLRSQGVPSRVVSGYAQGEFDEETSTYRVHANNAHTWVEVYFPSYGWVQFEPTASIPVVERSEGGGGDFLDALDGEDGNESGASVPLSELEDDQSRLEDLIDDETAAANRGFSFQTFPVVQTVIAVVILALAGLTLLMANKFNERVEADVDRSYTRLGWWARWVGIVLNPTQTPYERADLISTAVPDGHQPIRNLTNEYVHKRFSPNYEEAQDFDSRAEWKMLRPLLIRESMKHRWQNFKYAWQKRREK